jgi:hypothetical protein
VQAIVRPATAHCSLVLIYARQNVAVNIAAGAANTQANSRIYANSNDSVNGGALASGFAGGSGYLMGTKMATLAPRTVCST